MKGFVPTPPHLVDAMVGKLFRGREPRAEDMLLDPGCGTGAFIHGVLRWCQHRALPVPRIVGIELDPALLAKARSEFGDHPRITLLNEDFLTPRADRFDYVLGNPPYVPITGLTVAERAAYRQRYLTATGRFDLYLLFFEQALRLLVPNGRLVFITPEKFLYVQTAEPLRRELARQVVEEIELVNEAAFGNLVTYPTITTILASSTRAQTRVGLRDGTVRRVRLPADGSWLPAVNGSAAPTSGPVLADAFVRISCGVATGADAVYTVRDSEIHATLRPFAFPTVSGRQMVPNRRLTTTHSLLVPYRRDGRLLPEPDLGPLGDYLRQPERRRQLVQRTCARRKPWYAFHENPPLDEILRPKILCKDIGARPWFVIDEAGVIVPRHSVYYLVPDNQGAIHELCEYLNSAEVLDWLMAHCQRAANGFVRLQSHVLKRVPLPERFLGVPQLAVI